MDLKLYWIVNLLIILSVPFVLIFMEDFSKDFFMIFFIYFYIFGIICMIPVVHIFGSNWRNQHFLSRYYLLSLPVDHGKLFIIQQLRILACWATSIAFLVLLPFLLFLGGHSSFDQILFFPIYYMTLIASILYVVNLLMFSMLKAEKITSYKMKKERFWSHVRFIGITIVGSVLLVLPWAFTIEGFSGAFSKYNGINKYSHILPLACMVPMLFMGIYFYLSNKKDWCVTFSKAKNKNA